MQYLPTIFQVYTFATIGVLAWFALDMRSILRSGGRKNQLAIEGRWKELEEHFERTLKTWRPFVWLHYRYLLPGNFTVQYALFLYNQGRLEEALAKIDQAIRWNKGKPLIFRSIHRSATFTTLCGALKARTLVLTGMGRYDEARQTAAELQRLIGPKSVPNPALALLEFYCGHLDEALALAEIVPPKSQHYDPMRIIVALSYSTKGEFDQAIQALLYEPGDATKFYTPENLKIVRDAPGGDQLLELQSKKIGGVFKPARLLLLANVYLSQEDFQNADLALDQAEKLLGPEPGIQLSYWSYRASSLAGQGAAAEAEGYIERMRKMIQQLPKRSLLWETHFTAGRSYLYLRRFADALAELAAAEQSALHPTEKHTTAYWIARTHEAVGEHDKAALYYQIVVADKIPSWMRKSAVEKLSLQKS